MNQDLEQAPRTPLQLDVEFKRNYAREVTKGSLRNVSVTGAFVAFDTKESIRPGEKIHLTFKVSGRERTVDAQVVWAKSGGVGVKFLPTNNRDIQIVDDLIYFVEAKRSDKRDILDSIFRKVG